MRGAEEGFGRGVRGVGGVVGPWGRLELEGGVWEACGVRGVGCVQEGTRGLGRALGGVSRWAKPRAGEGLSGRLVLWGEAGGGTTRRLSSPEGVWEHLGGYGPRPGWDGLCRAQLAPWGELGLGFCWGRWV